MSGTGLVPFHILTPRFENYAVDSGSFLPDGIARLAAMGEVGALSDFNLKG
jgi:hypothetical protein